MAAIADSRNLSNKHLTLYQFNGVGKLVMYSNDHEEYLARQPFFFARKIARHADELRNRLDKNASKTSNVGKLSQDSIGRHSDEYRRFLKKHAYGYKGKQPVGKLQHE